MLFWFCNWFIVGCSGRIIMVLGSWRYLGWGFCGSCFWYLCFSLYFICGLGFGIWSGWGGYRCCSVGFLFGIWMVCIFLVVCRFVCVGFVRCCRVERGWVVVDLRFEFCFLMLLGIGIWWFCWNCCSCVSLIMLFFVLIW